MTQSKNKRTLFRSLFAVVVMFGFGFALVPLYDVFCEVTGLNGKTGGPVKEADVVDKTADLSRTVRVQFVTQNNEDMPWEFRPMVSEVKVHPGELTAVEFFARNNTVHAMTAQAVPSISPSQGAQYFHKTECFCFSQQTLAAKQEVLMPLRFVVDKALPEGLPVLTLSYTLFDQHSETTADTSEQTSIQTEPTLNPKLTVAKR